MRQDLCDWDTHMLRQWQWYLDTAGCSHSVLGALQDCDWWCSRLQGSGCVPGDRVMRQCVYVWEREKAGACEGMCVFISTETCYKCQMWILAFRSLDTECFQLACHSIITEASAWSRTLDIQTLALHCTVIFFSPPINSIKQSFSDW